MFRQKRDHVQFLHKEVLHCKIVPVWNQFLRAILHHCMFPALTVPCTISKFHKVWVNLSKGNGDTKGHKQRGDHISLLCFYQNKESRLSIK
jgi:hypothetical protein